MKSSTYMDTVKLFIKAINDQNIDRLTELMAADHTFIDSAGSSITGAQEMAKGWKQYFRMFPDYRIVVDHILENNTMTAVFGSASGTYNGNRGLIPENIIEGPAAWRAVVENGTIDLWQVYADWTEGAKIIEADQRANVS